MYRSASAGVMLGNKLIPKLTGLRHTLGEFRICCGSLVLEQALSLAVGWTGLAPGCGLGSHLPPVHLSQWGGRGHGPPGHVPLRAEH